MKIPSELVFLGLAQKIGIVEDLDDTDRDPELTTIDLKGTSYRERRRAASDRRVWIMATDPGSIEAPPGDAYMYLIRAPFTRNLEEDPDYDPTDDALDTFHLWHNREADRTFSVDKPDKVDTYFGHITAIVYASDKKENRGKVEEYYHDFYENHGEPPQIFFDTPDPDDASAALIIGGTMSISERGII
jgi:hypothetical protein